MAGRGGLRDHRPRKKVRYDGKQGGDQRPHSPSKGFKVGIGSERKGSVHRRRDATCVRVDYLVRENPTVIFEGGR